MQKDLAYASGSIITLLFMSVIAYHAYTEIIIKSKLWIALNESLRKSKAMIRDVTTINCAMTSVHEPLSYTTSVVDAPKRDEPKHAGYGERNLQELLLESSVNGAAGLL